MQSQQRKRAENAKASTAATYNVGAPAGAPPGGPAPALGTSPLPTTDSDGASMQPDRYEASILPTDYAVPEVPIFQEATIERPAAQMAGNPSAYHAAEHTPHPFDMRSLHIARQQHQGEAEAADRKARRAVASTNQADVGGTSSNRLTLVQRLINWMNVPDWTLSQDALRTSPDLLTDSAENALETLSKAQSNEEVRNIITDHQHLVRLCRKYGVDEGYRHFLVDDSTAQASGPSARRSNLSILSEIQVILSQARLLVEPENLLEHAQLVEAALTRVHHEEDGPLWAALQADVGSALEHASTGDPRDNLDRAIAAYRAALTIRTPTTAPSDWARTQFNLANALRRRAELKLGAERRTGMEEAVAAYREALVSPIQIEASDMRAMVQNNLAVTLRKRAELEQGEERLMSVEEAIGAYREVLTVYTRNATPSDWAMAQNNLANALADRAELTQGEQRRISLEEAIAAYRAALTIRSQDAHADQWALTMNNLGTALAERAELEHGQLRKASLDEAIDSYHEALTIRTPTAAPTECATTQNNLAVALRMRAELEQDESQRISLGEAVHLLREAVTVYTCDTAADHWAALQNNLAVTLHTRAEREHEAERRASLEEAIIAYRDALTIRTRDADPSNWALTQNNLANALRALAELERGEERLPRLDEAVRSYHAALTIYTQGGTPLQWAAAQNNLAVTLRERAESQEGEERRASLEKAIAACRNALTVRTHSHAPIEWAMSQNNLANILRVRSERERGGTRQASVEEAIGAYREALTIYNREFLLIDHFNTATAAGLLCFRESRWATASAFFASAIEALDDLYALSLTTAGRIETLERGRDLSAHFAYSLVRTEVPGIGLEAARALESGRARASGDAVRRHYADLELAAQSLPQNLLEDYRAARARLVEVLHGHARVAGRETWAEFPAAHGKDSAEDQYDAAFTQFRHEYEQARTARTGYDAAIARIREHIPTFLRIDDPLPAAVHELRADERLVYVAATSAGAVAIVIGQDVSDTKQLEYQVYWDKLLTNVGVHNMLAHRDSTSGVVDGLIPAQYPTARKGALDDVLARIQVTLGNPDGVLSRIAAGCQALGIHRLVLIPGGMLGLLPLHAALVPSGRPTSKPALSETVPLHDVARVSYAPSARIWEECRMRAVACGARTPEALVVGNPWPQPRAEYLHGAIAEVTRVRATVVEAGGRVVPPDITLDANAATRPAVFSALAAYGPSLTHAHFACHGTVEWLRPERSGLLLAHGSRLMVRDLLDEQHVRLHCLRLATLSACQSGIPGVALPDEVISLPTAWLQAGTAGVVASLWPVSDNVTVALMEKFYQLLLLDHLEPGEALWLAQRWLRGLPAWREEFLTAGAVHGSEGPEARGVVMALAQSPESLSERYSCAGDELIRNEGDGDEETRGDGRAWAATRYWAAFAHYGA